MMMPPMIVRCRMGCRWIKLRTEVQLPLRLRKVLVAMAILLIEQMVYVCAV
jgi:hypothetical protein